MKSRNSKHFITISLASIISAFLSKDVLTPIFLLGKTYTARSPLVKGLILIMLIIAYFLLFWKLLPVVISRFPKKWIERIFLIIIFTATIGIMSSGLFQRGIFPAYDIDYHILRIESISQSLRLWQVPVRVNPIFLNHYGYASSLFYPDLFLYFPALLRLTGVSTILSAKIFFILIFAFCFLTSYWCGKKISGSSYAGYMTAVVYCLSQYFLQNVYVRGAVGEMQAFIFLPLILYGLYSLIFDQFKAYWVMALGFIGLFYSHLISLLMAALLSVSVGIFYFRTILSDKIHISRITKLCTITLGTTIAFWLPLIEQMQSGVFKFNQSTYLLQYSALEVSTLFSVTGSFSGSFVAFGLPTLILCLVWFSFRKVKDHDGEKQIVGWALGIGAILLFMVTNKFPWEWISGPLNIIQFPWRLYSFASVFISLAIGMMFDIILPKKDKLLGIFLIVIIMGIPAIWVVRNSGSEPRDLQADFFQQPENSFLINNGEWLPAQTSIEDLRASHTEVVDQKGNPVPFSRNGQLFLIKPMDDCIYLDLPLVYYKGYSALLIDDRGKKRDLVVEPANPNHTVRVRCENNSSVGTIKVSYACTLIQHISLGLNLLFFISIALIRRFKPQWIF